MISGNLVFRDLGWLFYFVWNLDFCLYIVRSVPLGPSIGGRACPVDYCTLVWILQHDSFVYQHQLTGIISHNANGHGHLGAPDATNSCPENPSMVIEHQFFP